ncbi:CTD nuclear envelope phosphatase 1 regulatory subunit 2 isoform X2 [Haemaphysalis longicornis]
MSLEQTACEDLKAFERRLTEVIGYLNPQTKRWRSNFSPLSSLILFISSICTAIGAWQWLMDPVTSQATFLQSLMNHMFFTISSIILVILFLMGIHKRVITPSIIVSRVRNVLSDFNMSCDDGGRLILRPRPTTS